MFSSSEVALQNVFEMGSYLTTIVFAAPEQFQIPVMVSLGAVMLAAVCFAAYVRKERGHLVHLSACLERKEYTRVEEHTAY
jgi:solute carrier family 40 (iron-regulated transporter), member 1